jgi:hypothetical protein
LALELAGLLVYEDIVPLDALPAEFEDNYQVLTNFEPNQGQLTWEKGSSLFSIFERLYTYLLTKHASAALLLTLISVYGPWEVPISFLENLEFFEADSRSEELKSITQLKALVQDRLKLRLAVRDLDNILLCNRTHGSERRLRSISLHGLICQWVFDSASNKADLVIQASYGLAQYLWSFYGKYAFYMRIGLRHFLFKIKAAETDRCSCDEGSQTPRHILMQCPQYIIPRTKLWEQLDRVGIGITEIDYDKIMSNPQATRYVVNFMHRTGLLQQFQHVGTEEDDDEPTGLAAMDLGVEDDGY